MLGGSLAICSGASGAMLPSLTCLAKGSVVTQSTPLMQNYTRQPVRFVRGRGVWLEDADGRHHIDAFAGVAVSALGHAHPELVAAISRQAGELIHVSNHYTIPQQEILAGALVAALGAPGRVLFCNSGTEANEAAYKCVRVWANQVHGGRKPRHLAFQGGFHGRTMGAVSLTANPAYREPFAPILPVEFLPFGDAAALAAAMGDDVAGVFLEPIQGEGGVNTPPAGYLTEVRRLCDQHQALMVVDEVQTGIGRTGKAFDFQHDGIVPDVVTMAKGLGGGVPIGAVWFGERCQELLKPGMHGTTFGGNLLACAAAQCVTGIVLQPDFLAQVAAKGQRLAAGLAQAFPGCAIRGRGLLLGVQLARAPGEVVAAALARGAIVGPSGNNTLRVAPPLIISEDEIEELVRRLTF